MFRELTRKNRQLPEEDCISLLCTEKRGVLSVLGDEDYPYGTPMNHWYNPEDGNLYFHCGKTGHRLDALKRHDKVSYCVYDHGTCAEGEWALRVKSVVVFGRMEILDDPGTIVDVATKLSYKFTRDEEYIQKEIRAYAHETLILKLVPEHISGKRITES